MVNLHVKCLPIAAGSIRAEVSTQADYVILHSGKSEFFAQNKLNENDVTGAQICYTAPECHWYTRLKRWLQCRGHSSSGVGNKKRDMLLLFPTSILIPS